MASMLFRTSVSRLALGALLFTPAMCMAGVLPAGSRTAQQDAGWTDRGSSTANIAATLAEWQSLKRDPRPSFDRVAAFLLAHPGWPDEGQLKRAAENALDVSGYIPPHAADYFARFAPTSAGGHLRHALALHGAGKHDEGEAAARRAWTTGALSADEEMRLLTFFPGALTPADHDARMERLLWSNATTAAARQASLVSPARSLEFNARLAMRQRSTVAALRAAEAEAADPALLRANAGYIADKAAWLAATGQAAAARALLAGPRQLAAPPLDAEKWLETLLSVARGAAAAGDHRNAYEIARKVDDALPFGAAILEQPLGVRDDYTSLVWLAASAAHHNIDRPREAVGLYALYAGGGRSPQVQARGLYWAGRAALDAGDTALANEYFARAGRHYDQFHGQLALERLGQAQPRPTDAQVSFSAAERDEFNSRSIVQAARMLGRTGQWTDQTAFLRAIELNVKSDAEHYFAGQLAAEIGRPDLAVRVGKSARVNGLGDYVPVAFPTVPVPPGYEDNWVFIHAISRQESLFDRAAVSHAGARGLMQLMPGTARETAGRLGLSYDLSSLTSDTSYNIMLGSTYFRRMMSYYGGSYPLAVAAYNAGPGNVNKWLRDNGDPRTGGIDILDWIEKIPFTETRGYVQRVLENAVVYDTMRPGANGERRNRLSYYLGKPYPG